MPQDLFGFSAVVISAIPIPRDTTYTQFVFLLCAGMIVSDTFPILLNFILLYYKATELAPFCGKPSVYVVIYKR